MLINIYAAWVSFFLGCCAGALSGLFFHREAWLGGYDSWSRRMIRLAHIAFFGLGFLNLLFGLTSRTLDLSSGLALPSILLLIGTITMPLICYLSAWKAAFRHIFFVPASSIMVGIALFLLTMVSG